MERALPSGNFSPPTEWVYALFPVHETRKKPPRAPPSMRISPLIIRMAFIQRNFLLKNTFPFLFFFLPNYAVGQGTTHLGITLFPKIRKKTFSSPSSKRTKQN